jgi:hypothetical protein
MIESAWRPRQDTLPYREVEDDHGDAGEEADEAGGERDEIAAGRRILSGSLHRRILIRRPASNKAESRAPAAARQSRRAAARAVEPEDSGRGPG